MSEVRDFARASRDPKTSLNPLGRPTSAEDVGEAPELGSKWETQQPGSPVPTST